MPLMLQTLVYVRMFIPNVTIENVPNELLEMNKRRNIIFLVFLNIYIPVDASEIFRKVLVLQTGEC